MFEAEKDERIRGIDANTRPCRWLLPTTSSWIAAEREMLEGEQSEVKVWRA